MKAAGLALVAVLAALQAERAYELAQREQWEAARSEYEALLREHPDDDVNRYNLGTVLLLAGRHDDARAPLAAAATTGAATEGAASYNLGNTDLEPAFADSALVERQARLRRAIEAYKQALLVNPDDADAKWNLELARRLLEREPPPAGGGGGGGGGQGPPQAGERQPDPAPAGGAGREPDASESEAENLLRAAQERELQVQRERLQKPQPPGPIRP